MLLYGGYIQGWFTYHRRPVIGTRPRVGLWVYAGTCGR